MASSRSEEMLASSISNTWRCHSVGVPCNFILDHFCLECLADVIGNVCFGSIYNLYMVVPYHQGLSERIKKTCNKFGVQVHFKGGQTIKSLLISLWLPRTKILLPTKVESYIDTNAVNMGVRKNILASLLELLQKGSRNTRRPLYLTTVTPQVITSTSIISL